MSDQPVYSTQTGSNKKPKKNQSMANNVTYTKGDGPAKMRLESKGRRGKSVTVVWNLPWTEADAREAMKTMQARFGCGATLKGAQMEFQGDRRQQVEAFFSSQNLPLKRAGG